MKITQNTVCLFYRNENLYKVNKFVPLNYFIFSYFPNYNLLHIYMYASCYICFLQFFSKNVFRLIRTSALVIRSQAVIPLGHWYNQHWCSSYRVIYHICTIGSVQKSCIYTCKCMYIQTINTID